MPINFKLTPPQQKVVDCIRGGEPIIDRAGLAQFLNTIKWPAYFLDFESIITALPFWPDIATYQQVPTQFSLHICDRPGEVREHHEYLASHERDCQRELAEDLLLKLEELGSIVVYSDFEEKMLEYLGERFPDLYSKFQDCLLRLFDLEKVFLEYFSHPKFRGRTSIKYTLPALVPDMSYDSLKVGDGQEAVAAFVQMVKGCYDQAEMVETRAALLKYCHQDTLAMVRLHAIVLTAN